MPRNILRHAVLCTATACATHVQDPVEILLFPVFFGESPLVVPLPVGPTHIETTTMAEHISNYCVQHRLSRATCNVVVDGVSGAWDALHQFSFLRIDDERATWSVVPSSPLEMATSICNYLSHTVAPMPAAQRDSCMMTLKLEFSRTTAWLQYRQRNDETVIHDGQTLAQPTMLYQPPRTLISERSAQCHINQEHGNHTISSVSMAHTDPWPLCLGPAFNTAGDSELTTLASPSLKSALPTGPVELQPEPAFHSHDVVIATTTVTSFQTKSNKMRHDQQNATPPSPMPTLRRTRPKEVARRGQVSLSAQPTMAAPQEPWSSSIPSIVSIWIAPVVVIAGTALAYMRVHDAHTAQLTSLHSENAKLQASLDQLFKALQDSIVCTETVHADHAAKVQQLESEVAKLTRVLDDLRAAKPDHSTDTLVHSTSCTNLIPDTTDAMQRLTGSTSVFIRRLSGSLVSYTAVLSSRLKERRNRQSMEQGKGERRAHFEWQQRPSWPLDFIPSGGPRLKTQVRPT
ncbi:hypothetical protein, variant 1 [Aphanomyces invadans]|uniref:Uncharacterized protein n=1 Tax=Aphanomyces invadans TaxID=157072 RepID=A0A024UES3_9STRA|nr:hypothetical protein, variant 1 [Aphanomyces invadans]ETW04372.1 hypothetical protein, variant 1 [Aphanomyces invadans]|eukprot:XP_008867328.1 hypothetical protein, variant 1 [Aphanomyces invadans]